MICTKRKLVEHPTAKLDAELKAHVTKEGGCALSVLKNTCKRKILMFELQAESGLSKRFFSGFLRSEIAKAASSGV